MASTFLLGSVVKRCSANGKCLRSACRNSDSDGVCDDGATAGRSSVPTGNGGKRVSMVGMGSPHLSSAGTGGAWARIGTLDEADDVLSRGARLPGGDASSRKSKVRPRAPLTFPFLLGGWFCVDFGGWADFALFLRPNPPPPLAANAKRRLRVVDDASSSANEKRRFHGGSTSPSCCRASVQYHRCLRGKMLVMPSRAKKKHAPTRGRVVRVRGAADKEPPSRLLSILATHSSSRVLPEAAIRALKYCSRGLHWPPLLTKSLASWLSGHERYNKSYLCCMSYSTTFVQSRATLRADSKKS